MNTKNIFKVMLLAATLLSASCIREEALNAECDITGIDATWLEENRDVIVGAPIISNYAVEIVVKDGTDCSSFKPLFTLSQGAWIELDSIVDNGATGATLYYTTHSEDGIWQKEYKVRFIVQAPITKDQIFSFENFELDQPEPKGRYNVWYEVDDNNTRRNIWASGNAGFAFTGKGKSPTDFPTTTEENGVNGNCVKLETKDTGSFGKMAGMPIAAGNIFIGEFQVANAMTKPLEATRFGLQIVPSKPRYLKGFYKYTPGEVFTDKKKNPVEGRRDTCAIYSVLYEVDPDNFVSLDGSNITSSERIVLIAEIKNPGEPTGWTEFNIPFEPRNGKEFDPARLANNGYAITVVASSSKDGAFFEGAVGSTLYIDEISIVWEAEEE